MMRKFMGRKYYFYLIFISFYFTFYSLSLAGLAETRQRQGKARQESFGRIGRQAKLGWQASKAGRQASYGQAETGWLAMAMAGRQAGERICLGSFFYYIYFFISCLLYRRKFFFFLYLCSFRSGTTYLLYPNLPYHATPNHTIPYRTVSYLPIYLSISSIFDLLSFFYLLLLAALLPCCLVMFFERTNRRTDERTNEGNAA